MTVEYLLYLNDHYFDSLYDHNFYGDRPESQRHHARSLWIVYQILKSGGHTLVITDNDRNQKETIKNEIEFKKWVQKTYQGFDTQLDQLIYTKSSHPDDKLKVR